MRHRLQRLSWRVPLGCLLYLAPRLLGLGEAEGQVIREGAMAFIVASLASWLATQGRRRPRQEDVP